MERMNERPHVLVQFRCHLLRKSREVMDMRQWNEPQNTAFEGTLTRHHRLVACESSVASGIIQVSNGRAPQLSRCAD